LIKVFSVAALLLVLGACGTSLPVAGKPAPAGPPPPPMSGDTIVCPADVKQCPDGSYVSRNPGNGCIFDPCPGARIQ
jgi:hypothetical protein